MHPHPPAHRLARLPLLLLILLLCQLRPLQAQTKPDADKKTPALHPLRVEITFDAKITDRPFTGRVFVVASRAKTANTPPRINWFDPAPFFAQDVKGWAAGKPLLPGADLLAFPPPVNPGKGQELSLPAGNYTLQAAMDLDLGGASCFASPGNGFSKGVAVTLPQEKPETITLHIDQIATERPFTEKERVKLVDIESKLLTKFHGKPIRLRAGVVLPKSFDAKADQKYPVVYEIPGFGGDHFEAFRGESRDATNVAGVDMIYVALDPNCRTGHHVFADSANNGPYGQALIEELIPHIETKYRGLARPSARFVTGHSSGGWSSLWLQVAYADFFGGTWSTAPDPVDFRDFQKINLYAPDINMFTDEKGERRPIARVKGKPILFYKPFSEMEDVMGRGGQLYSFEAVFSSRGVDGQPIKLWDRRTGKVDPDVAHGWEKYDIRLNLEKNWKLLGPKLGGKLHVYMGDADTFYLEGATMLLQKSLKDLGSDAVVEIFPGKDHGNLVDGKLRSRINAEMAAAFRKGPP